LVLDNRAADELLVRLDKGEEISETIAGVGLVRGSTESATSSAAWRRNAGTQGIYNHFHNRNWYLPTLPLQHHDRVMISLARDLPNGYMVLTRTAPTALATAAAMQVKFVANLVYYSCDELSEDGVPQVADRRSLATPVPRYSSRGVAAPLIQFQHR